MARDFHIRLDLQQLGLPERTIRVLEKAALLVQLIEDQAATEGEVAAIDTAVTALQEEQEDQNLSLATLDTRLDALEVDAPYVEVSGDAMTGALDVQALLQCDSFRIDQTPTLEAIVPTHSITISANGTNYKFAVVAA